MDAHISAPLLSRLKSWQLVGLGISGWCTLYSVAMLTWGASSALVGNTQGGCFATAMTLAGVEVKRYRKGGLAPDNSLQWAEGIPTAHLNQTLALAMQARDFRIEHCPPSQMEMGFGVRAVNVGRTIVFETARWKEPVIDLPHAQATEENRKRASADFAIIVGAGTADEAAREFVGQQPLQLLVGQELKNLLSPSKPS
jgi:hypothetical protein